MAETTPDSSSFMKNRNRAYHVSHELILMLLLHRIGNPEQQNQVIADIRGFAQRFVDDARKEAGGDDDKAVDDPVAHVAVALTKFADAADNWREGEGDDLELFGHKLNVADVLRDRD